MKESMTQLKKILQQQPLMDLSTALTTLAVVQEIVSKPVLGCIPPDGELPSKDAIRTYALALQIELSEFVQTLDWKPWKDKPEINKDRVIDEFADMLAFLGVIIYYLKRMDITPRQLADGYSRKSIVNIERFLGEHGVEYKQSSLFEETKQ